MKSCKRAPVGEIILMTVIVLLLLIAVVVAADFTAANAGIKAAPPSITKLTIVQQTQQRKEEMVAAIAEYDAQVTERPTVPADAVKEATPEVEDAVMDSGPLLLEAIPLPFVLQETLQEACAEWNVPYSLALAVAETESGFVVDAISPGGDVGLMQLNPGPGGAYHASAQAVTGLDPTTPGGNIAGGCYLLGSYLSQYDGSVTKALMAYNCGQGGAAALWADGVYSTHYTEKVTAAMEKWEQTLDTANWQEGT